MAPDWQNAIERARAHSPFLSLAMDRNSELTEILAAGKAEEALTFARGAGDGCEDVGVALRRERLALALALGIGDLASEFPLYRVVQELSTFADRALDAAISEAILRRVPDAKPAGFIGLALGKHGAGELNYSSDIDPILLFDPETLPRRGRDDPGEAAQRVARRIIETLSNVTGEGYVFRVDLRLRPASEVSPLAISVDGALSHYESSALTWERAAFIRARACAGDIAKGEELLSSIRPFIWRKGLDFGAISEIGRLTAQIRADNKGSQTAGLGFDLKKGRGGIREIEFYAQTHQLIHGGRNPDLRLKGTRETLDALAKAELIGEDDAQLLGESYDTLRMLEHRLQMVSDHQTHKLPEREEALDNVAKLHGLESGNELIDEVAAITEAVGSRYDALLDASPATSMPVKMPQSGPALETALDQLGFADPHVLSQRIAGWKSGQFRALRSDAAHTAFDAIEPELLAALAQAPEPERAILRWERLLANLPSALNLFNLLEARPGLFDLLARTLSLAGPLADELARRSDLLDPLIDASAFDLLGSVEQLTEQLSRRDPHDSYEDVLDTARREVGELRFALGVQLIEGASDQLDVGAALARIAEAAVEVLASATIDEFRKSHGDIAGSELVILGLGRMGGGVLTHASDLDLVFLFTGDHLADSTGTRPIGATLYYNRLCQRVIAALSVPTAEGALYEIDTRLRPSGQQGPPAASFDSFERYQREQAWTWEHMALTRARPVFGSANARTALNDTITKVLTSPRNSTDLRTDVLKMRATMAEHKQPKGPLDIKLARGGLVDLEFLVHFLQLREGTALKPDLGEAIRELVSASLLPSALIESHAAMTRFLIAARLLAPDSKIPHAAGCAALAKSCGWSDWDSAITALGEARSHVASIWSDLFGENLEITT